VFSQVLLGKLDVGCQMPDCQGNDRAPTGLSRMAFHVVTQVAAMYVLEEPNSR
jgi:hypothetical protein